MAKDMVGVESHPEGHIFFDESNRAEHAWQIVEGAVELSIMREGRAIALERLEHADVFGEDALHGVARGFHTAKAVAVAPTTVRVVPIASFEAGMDALSDDVRAYVEWMFDFNFDLAQMIADQR